MIGQPIRGLGSNCLDTMHQKTQYINHKKRVRNARKKGFPMPLMKQGHENSSSAARINNAKAVIDDEHRKD